MSDTSILPSDTDNDAPTRNKLPARKGIKANSVSHRKNAAKRKSQHAKNAAARAALYQEKGRISAAEWHSRLDGLSKGTV
jgi:hypothetical protein